jgi:hypothetical protein
MELMKLMEDWKGYTALSDVKKPENWEAQLKETIDLLSNAKRLPQHRHEYLIREALTTSDFPYLFGDILDRQVLASYRAVDPVWKAFVKMSTVKDFKVSRRFAITGGDQYLAEVAEKGEYLASERTEGHYDLSVKKYGRQFDISWESLINDDLGALKDTPERFARAAVRTEHRITTGLYADNATLYQLAGGQANRVVTALTIGSLEVGLQAMAGFLDANGEPIMNRAKFLVVPPALEMTARQILTSATKMWLATTNVPATAVPYPTNNVVSQMGLTLIIDPYLPVMDVTPSGNTGWYLFANPADIAALEVAHLLGHEVPEICMKASDKVSVGGGAVGPMDGDFATDNVFYRVRVVFGGTRLDWRATYMGGSD